jgi:hypothetical protein
MIMPKNLPNHCPRNDRRSDKRACDFFVGYLAMLCVCVYIYIYDLVELVVEETPACFDNLLRWHLTYMGVVRNLAAAAAPTSS